MRINNKVKQHADGRKIKLQKDVDVVTRKARRDRVKQKDPLIMPWLKCPHCNKELPLAENQSDVNSSLMYVFGGKRIDKCPNCGSYKIENGCPACKRESWYNPSTETYKHQLYLSCGFNGKLLKRGN